MRLIDADKLRMKLYGFERYTGIDEAPYEYAEAVLNKEPTVDAIPVKWIQRWWDANYKYVDLEVGDLLNDWRRENETKNSAA